MLDTDSSDDTNVDINVNIADKASWKSLLHDYGDVINSANMYDIDCILKGKCDLVVPRMMAVIQGVSRCLDGSWMIKLIDPSSINCIVAYVAKEVESMDEGLLVEGNTILLENCSIFINKRPFSRMINIVQRNIIAIYSSKNELREVALHEEEALHDTTNTINNVTTFSTNLHQDKENIVRKKKSID